MILKNPEAFRSWLIRQLEPICKANPEPVSKYVCALLKKEKSDDELKTNLISHLYIFLHSATEEFVNFLIDALEDDKYVTSGVDFKLSELSDSALKTDDKSDSLGENDSESNADPSETKSPSSADDVTISPVPKETSRKSSPKRSNRSLKPRSQTHKSRRDSSGSDTPQRKKRNVSGSSEESNESPRRSWIASKSSDPKKYKHRSSGRSPPTYSTRSNSPKPRRSSKTTSYRKRPRGNTHPNLDDKRTDVDNRSTFENDKRELTLAPTMNHDLPLAETVFEGKQRCLDFEGKGFCARGDMCPFDHGPAPIVLNNSVLNTFVPYPQIHPGGFPNPTLYPPQFPAPHNFPRKPFRPDVPVSGNRELISVPTVPLPQANKHLNSTKPSYGHIFSSLPPGVSQATIELTNVPSEKNNIPDLYGSFSKFGTLTLVQAKRNGDDNIALLTYTNATEAALAFTNVESAMTNVKAAWYADKCILKPFPRKSIPASNNQSNNKSFALKRSAPSNNDASQVKKPTLAESPRKEPEPTNLTETEKIDVQQDPVKLLSDLIKKKKELLTKQLESRKQIVQKIKSLDAGSEEVKTWKDVLQKLNDVISENQKSFRESLHQKKEYLQKKNVVAAGFKDQTVNGQQVTENDSTNQKQEKDENIPQNVKPEEESVWLEISGFENGDEKELIEHFSQFGKIIDKEIDSTIPSAKIIFEDRKSAENALREGKTFQDRLLSVTIICNNNKMMPVTKKPMYKQHKYPYYSQYGGNRYKYKNPKLANSLPGPCPIPGENTTPNPTVCKTDITNDEEEEQIFDNSNMKLTDDEDLVTFLQKGGIDAKVVEKYMN